MPQLEHVTAQVDRLTAFDAGPFPLISLYLNLQANERGRDSFESFLRKELTDRLRTYPAHGPERESLEKDAAKIRDYVANIDSSLNGLAIFARAGKDRESVQRRIDVRDVVADLRGIFFEALALRSMRRIGSQPIGELFSEERFEGVAAAFVCLKVQVQADERKRAGIKCGETIDLRGNVFQLRHGSNLRKPRAAISALL